MKKYSLALAALFFSACISSQGGAPTKAPQESLSSNCPNVVFSDSKMVKYLGCELVTKEKNDRKVVNIKLENKTKKESFYKVKITWSDADGMTTDAYSDRLTTEYIEVPGYESKNLLFLAPSKESVQYKANVIGLKSMPKDSLYEKTGSTMGSNDFSITTDKLVKQMYHKKISSDRFLNCGSEPCNLMVERIKNNTRQDFSPKIIKEELLNAISDYQLANVIDSISGDGSHSQSYNIARSIEGDSNFNQDKVVQSGNLVGPTHSIRGVVTQDTNFKTKETTYYLDISINRIATGEVEWKGREKINKKH